MLEMIIIIMSNNRKLFGIASLTFLIIQGFSPAPRWVWVRAENSADLLLGFPNFFSTVVIQPSWSGAVLSKWL